MDGGLPRSQGTLLTLRVLGAFELVDQTSGIPVPVSAAKMRALLAYLCTTKGYSETRRRLAELLWSGHKEDQARHNLRQLLSVFKRTIESQWPGAIMLDDSNISLDPACVHTDYRILWDARQSHDIDELRRAADTYRGEFGVGLGIGQAEFDDWLGGERTRCREVAIVVFDRLIRLLTQTGEHHEALERANRLVEIEPFREETHRLVIEAAEKVSGRASALARFQSFKELLKSELDVSPEQATLDLVERLRGPVLSSDSVSPTTATVTHLPDAALSTQHENADRSMPSPVAKRPRRGLAMAAGLAAALLTSGLVAHQWRDAPIAFVGEDSGRVSVALLPFEFDANSEDMRVRARTYETEAKLAFARDNRFAIVEASATAPRDPIEAGRALRTRYVMRTSLSETAGNMLADVHLFDTASGISLSAASVPLDGGRIKFARELYRTVYPEIILHRAKTLAATEPDSIPALLWSAEAARIKTRVGTADPGEFALFEAVLKREPNQLQALLGLSNSLILRVAREQSTNRAEDIARASTLIARAREQAPNLADIAGQEGMINKLIGRFEEARRDFLREVRLDRTHWSGAAQAAHAQMFLGQFDEAYAEMEAATPNLLPDIFAAETAYIAGETALVAGHPDRAVTYLNMAVAGNPTVARIHGMRAAALWLAGQREEARAAALQSQKLAPPYTPELMAQRGRTTATPRFKEARDRYVAAYRAALAPVPASTN